MEHASGSECSSGCESGWTSYLGHSMYPCEFLQKSKSGDEDDMSMVSDASSGPPHVQEQEQECNKNGVSDWKRQKMVKEVGKIHDLPSFLDDTASSSFFNFSHVVNKKDSVGESNNVIADCSQDHFQGKSRFQNQFGLIKSSVSDGLTGGGEDDSIKPELSMKKWKDQGTCFVLLYLSTIKKGSFYYQER